MAGNGEMKLGEIKLQGWWAIPGIIVIAIGSYYYYSSMYSALKSPEMTEQIEFFIKSDYLRPIVEEVAAKLERGELSDEEAVNIDVVVTIESIDIKGLFSKEKHLRVKALIDGEPPPDGPEYWYFRANYSFLWGWHQPIGTEGVVYNLKMF